MRLFPSFAESMGVFTFNSCVSRLLQVSLGSRSTVCGGYQGTSALYFTGGGTRQVVTPVLSMLAGGSVSFYHRLGAGGYGSCENVDGGEGVVLEAQWSDAVGGVRVSWAPLFSSNTNLAYYKTMRFVSVSIPAGGWPGVQLRWRQLSHSGHGFDNWMVDNVVIGGETGALW